MGTEVLRPQDCLIERIRVGPAVFQHHRRRNFSANGYGNPNHRVISRKPVVRPEQKKRFQNNDRLDPPFSRRSVSLDDLRKGHNHHNHVVMGQVIILRRGESIDSKLNCRDNRHHRPVKKSNDDLVVYGTERLGPDPEMVPRQIQIGDLKSVLLSSTSASIAGDRSDMYAGSAFSMSPSPRSLPVPSFFSKKQASNAVDDSASRDLRRLLRLD